MKKFVWKELVMLLLIISTAFVGNAQSVTIFGSTSANVNDIETYAIDASGVTITKYAWTVTGGTIQSKTLDTATIKWTTIGQGKVNYYVIMSDVGGLEASLNVTVAAVQAPNTPPNPTILSQNCTSAVLQKSGTIPSGEMWYWQGISSSGTSTTYPATSNYTVTSTGTYYLRSKNTSSGLWSASSGFKAVTLGTVGGSTWYADTDNDGFGDVNSTLVQCTQPTGYVANSNDQCPNDYSLTNNGCPVVKSLSNENYIHTITPQIGVTDLSQLAENKDAIQNVTYFDGLGRSMQSIAIQQGGTTQKDIITHISYDAIGRQDKDYLPYVPTATGNEGTYRTDALSVTGTFYNTSKYENTTNPYSQKLFEASPLNRVLEQTSPGISWKAGTVFDTNGHSNGNTIKIGYQTNTTNEVKLFTVALTYANNTYTPSLLNTSAAFYTAGELYKSVTKDENWKTVDGVNKTTEEFKDRQGRVVLKRTYNVAQKHDTYYVYDDFGNLTYVLPPLMEASTAILTTIQGQLSELGYQYKYDHRNRLVEKKIPGKDWEYIVYDKLDRPVLTQDGNLKLQNKWLFTKYDVFGRVAYTGIYSINSTRGDLQTIFNNKIALQNYETKVTSGTGYDNTYYNNTQYPYTNLEVLTVNYYDDYNFDLAGTFNPNTNNSLVYSIYPTLRTKGLATGSKVKVLTTSNWITTVSYYDEKARPIRTYSYNDYLKTTDVVSNKLDFVKVTETTTSHTYINDLLPTITTVDKFDYDHAGRLLTQKQTITGNPEEVIVQNTYDELGQLTSKGVGGKTTQNRLQTVDYTYNIRGWLKGINDVNNLGSADLFGFKLNYNTVNYGATPLYNGNIAETVWRTANTDNSLKWYKYDYDALNRLTNAVDNLGKLNETLNYDKNGNINSLVRLGHIVGGTTIPDINNPLHFGTMDNLVYTYQANSNKLTIVSDTGNDTFGFKDDQIGTGADTTIDYTYDVNGNMLTDANKGITNISYNHLNLPTLVAITGGTILYIYDATGVKQRKIVSTGTTTDYAGNYVYENGNLQFFNQPEGYVEPNGSLWNYVYQYKDHLGNIRLSYKDISLTTTPSLQIVEENNYYPFGLKHKGYNSNIVSEHKRKFNGQEYDESLGLNITEMTFRQYDNALGRFMVIDAAAEMAQNWTPYRFGFNNPILFSDPLGLWEKKKNGSWTTDDKKDIERFMDMLAIESMNNGSVSGAQIDTFIKEEDQGSGGRLSDGSLLLDSQTITVSSKTGRSKGFSKRQVAHISGQVDSFVSNPYNEKSMGSHGHWAYSYKYNRERSYYANGGNGFSGIALSGMALDLTSDFMSNNSFWLGKNLKFYDVSWGGNGATGGKNKFAGKWSKTLGAAGGIIGLYGAYGTYQEYANGMLSGAGASYLGAADAAGLSGNPAAGYWSLGTGIGKAIVETEFNFNMRYKSYNW